MFESFDTVQEDKCECVSSAELDALDFMFDDSDDELEAQLESRPLRIEYQHAA